MKNSVAQGRSSAKSPEPRRSRRRAEKRPARADLDTPLSSGAAVAMLDALVPEEPAPRGALPRMIDGADLRSASLEELLMFGLAGESGGNAARSPLEAMADRHATEVNAFALITANDQEGGVLLVDLLYYASQRARVLAELLRRSA